MQDDGPDLVRETDTKILAARGVLADGYENVVTALETIEVVVSAIEQTSDDLRAQTLLSVQNARLTFAIQQRLVDVITSRRIGIYRANFVLKETKNLARPLFNQLVRHIIRHADTHIRLEAADNCRHNLSMIQWLRLYLGL